MCMLASCELRPSVYVPQLISQNMKPTLRLLLHQEEQKARHMQDCMRDSRLLFEEITLWL